MNMIYDIRNVGYEFMAAEECMKKHDENGAITHYTLVIRNYEYADNEYMINPDTPFIMNECGHEMKFPSLSFMVRKAEEELAKLRKK